MFVEHGVLTASPLAGGHALHINLARQDCVAGQHHRRRAIAKVDSDERLVAPHLHLPAGHVANARSAQMGHAAIGKFEPRLGHVLVLTEHGNAQGFNPGQRRVDERQHHVQIVDHQIEHHAHVGRAEGKSTGPHRLDEARLMQMRHGGRKRRIESLDMTDLHQRLLVTGHLQNFISLGQRAGNWFFDQHVNAAAHEFQRHFIVQGRGHGNHRGVHLV